MNKRNGPLRDFRRAPLSVQEEEEAEACRLLLRKQLQKAINGKPLSV